MLVVVPSVALSHYVAGVLPSLGVRGVGVQTFRGWAQSIRRRVLPGSGDKYSDDTPDAAARVKKHPALLRLLERTVASQVTATTAELRRELEGAEGLELVLGPPPRSRSRARGAASPRERDRSSRASP
jgi:hypothetical protein